LMGVFMIQLGINPLMSKAEAPLSTL